MLRIKVKGKTGNSLPFTYCTPLLLGYNGGMIRNRFAVKISVIVLIILVGGILPLHAQMDLLPFIFRDIPPELEQGIPTTMTYNEFRSLNRNIDFFTVGMSLIAPGYGFFSVDRPYAGAAVAGGRALGYGLMAAGVIRQWQDFRDVWNGQDLSAEEWDNLKVNAFLFGSGAFLNMVLWGVDVLGAYHVALEEKNWVIYHHGLKVEHESRGEHEIEQLRSYFLQDDTSVREYLRARLHRIAMSSSWGDFPEEDLQEALYYHGVMEYGRGRSERAVLQLLSAYTVTESQWQQKIGALIVDILSSRQALAWEKDRELLWEELGRAANEGYSYPDLVSLLPELEHAELRSQMFLMANRYLGSGEKPLQGDLVLFSMARAWAGQDDIRNAATAYAKLLRFYPESPMAEEARKRAAALYMALGDTQAAEALK